MGILDDLGESLNRGAASAERSMKRASLNGAISEAKERRALTCQSLGEKLYLQTKDNPAIRQGNETLYDSIAKIDAEIEGYRKEIESIETEAAAAAATAAAEKYNSACPKCGAPLAPGQAFCGSCGAKMELPAEPKGQQGKCPSCGAPLNDGDAFCINCGEKIAEAASTGEHAAEASADSTCPECGAKVNAQSPFCGECGAKLS